LMYSMCRSAVMNRYQLLSMSTQDSVSLVRGKDSEVVAGLCKCAEFAVVNCSQHYECAIIVGICSAGMPVDADILSNEGRV